LLLDEGNSNNLDFDDQQNQDDIDQAMMDTALSKVADQPESLASW